VFVEVAGSTLANPLGWVGLAGSALFLLGLVLAGFRKVRPSADDVRT
jgi:Na+-transporting NADH:ubiquinone oxidoreductase subunit NqrD